MKGEFLMRTKAVLLLLLLLSSVSVLVFATMEDEGNAFTNASSTSIHIEEVKKEESKLQNETPTIFLRSPIIIQMINLDKVHVDNPIPECFRNSNNQIYFSKDLFPAGQAPKSEPPCLIS